MIDRDILLLPLAVGLLTAAALPFSGYKWGGALVRPVMVIAIVLAAIQFGLGFLVNDNPHIGMGSARWMGNGGAVAILLANAVSLIITTRALKRRSRGLPYRF